MIALGIPSCKTVRFSSIRSGQNNLERTFEMSMIDGFELVSSGRSKPFITLRDASITFSKMAIESLDYAEFVHMYIDKKSRRVAFQASEDDEDSFIFYREPKPGRSMLVRLTTKGVASRVKELAGIESCENGLRYYGEYVEEEKLLIFDMKKKGVHAPTEGAG